MILPRTRCFTKSSLPADWSEEDDKWADKLNKAARREKKNKKLHLPIAGGLAGLSIGSSAAGLMYSLDHLHKKPMLKGKASYLVPASMALGAAGLGVYSGIRSSRTKSGKEYISSSSYDRKLGRYKKMDKNHRDWIRKYDKDPSKTIDFKYLRQGGYKPYKKNNKE